MQVQLTSLLASLLTSLLLQDKSQSIFCFPWIGEQPYTEMLFWQFSNIIRYVKIVGNIPDQHLNVWLFSNPGDKVQNRWRTTGQICPVLSTRIWTWSPGLENNNTFKCWSGIFPTTLTYMIILENCQTPFQCMVVLQSRGQNFILVEI